MRPDWISPASDRERASYSELFFSSADFSSASREAACSSWALLRSSSAALPRCFSASADAVAA